MSDQMRGAASGAPDRSGQDDPNIADLVGQLTHQGAHLAQEQISLMQAEVREAAQDVKVAVSAIAAAAVFGIAGLGVLLMGIAYYVGEALDDVALGTTIVGGATLVIALILYAGARKKVDSANIRPDRSIDTLADTSAAATGNINTSGGR